MLEKLLLAMATTLACYMTFRPSLPPVIGSIAVDADAATALEKQADIFSDRMHSDRNAYF